MRPARVLLFGLGQRFEPVIDFGKKPLRAVLAMLG
jgi:hypothetical protein